MIFYLLARHFLGLALARQFKWSADTFGHGYRMDALLNHIKSEILEVEKNPGDPVEWIDIALLALDGAWRCQSISGAKVAELMLDKMRKNRERKWSKPGADGTIEHVRDEKE